MIFYKTLFLSLKFLINYFQINKMTLTVRKIQTIKAVLYFNLYIMFSHESLLFYHWLEILLWNNHCHLTNPVSVFLTNSVSVSPNFCPTFLTNFRTGISFKIFLTNIHKRYSFKVFVNARKYWFYKVSDRWYGQKIH